MFDSVKKIFGLKKAADSKTEKSLSISLGKDLRAKSEKFSEFLSDRFEMMKEEFFSIKEKSKNLRQTNFELGLQHLENGALPEAILRFRIIKKFWPDFFDAYYQLAYCLVLHNKFPEAKKVLEELLAKEPNYDPSARELLMHLNQTNSDAKNS